MNYKEKLLIYVPVDNTKEINIFLAEWLTKQQELLRSEGIPLKVDVMIRSQYPIPANYNYMIAHGLANDYDYILSVEQDIVPNRNSLLELLWYIQKKEFDVVSGFYFNLRYEQNKNIVFPVVLERKHEGNYTLYENNPFKTDKEYIMANHTGQGFLMINKKILYLMRSQKFKFKEDRNRFEDVLRSQDTILADFFWKNDIKICVPIKAKCGHIKKFVY